MRREPTPAEALLWNKLRRHRSGFKFKRQPVIGPYIPDLYCHAAKLAVELDGSHHFQAEVRGYDDVRTAWLASTGIRVLRFSNTEVLNQTDVVLNRINVALEEARNGRKPSP